MGQPRLCLPTPGPPAPGHPPLYCGPLLQGETLRPEPQAGAIVRWAGRGAGALVDPAVLLAGAPVSWWPEVRGPPQHRGPRGRAPAEAAERPCSPMPRTAPRAGARDPEADRQAQAGGEEAQEPARDGAAAGRGARGPALLTPGGGAAGAFGAGEGGAGPPGVGARPAAVGVPALVGLHRTRGWGRGPGRAQTPRVNSTRPARPPGLGGTEGREGPPRGGWDGRGGGCWWLSCRRLPRAPAAGMTSSPPGLPLSGSPSAASSSTWSRSSGPCSSSGGGSTTRWPRRRSGWASRPPGAAGRGPARRPARRPALPSPAGLTPAYLQAAGGAGGAEAAAGGEQLGGGPGPEGGV